MLASAPENSLSARCVCGGGRGSFTHQISSAICFLFSTFFVGASTPSPLQPTIRQANPAAVSSRVGQIDSLVGFVARPAATVCALAEDPPGGERGVPIFFRERERHAQEATRTCIGCVVAYNTRLTFFSFFRLFFALCLTRPLRVSRSSLSAMLCCQSVGARVSVFLFCPFALLESAVPCLAASASVKR